MFRRATNFLLDIRDRQRINIAITKGGVAKASRRLDMENPASWEFSGFSQNGEDGILDVLRAQLCASNRYCIEIGGADGIENNTAWLLVVEQYDGLMIEGNPKLAARAARMIMPYCIGAECMQRFVTIENVAAIWKLAKYSNPDVFSLDIDGNDLHIARAILRCGFRPKIFAVEYNAVFGEIRSVTIPYSERFDFSSAHPSQLYYGASIQAWKRMFAAEGYVFVTVNTHGVNAFFIDPSSFDPMFLTMVTRLDFAENVYQRRKWHASAEEQYRKIANLPLEQIEN